MTAAQIITSDHDDRTHRFRRTLTWLIGISFSTAVIYGLMAIGFSLPILWILVGAILVEGLIFIGIGRLIGRTSLAMPGLLVGISMMGLIAVLGVLFPDMYSPLVASVFLSITLALPYVDGRGLRTLGLLGLATTLFVTVSARYLTVVDPLPEQVAGILNIFGNLLVMGISLWLLLQFHVQLNEALHQALRTNTALVEAQSGLEQQVAARTAELQDALSRVTEREAEQRALLAELAQQREAIRELSVPILPVARTALVMPRVGALDSSRLQQMREQALTAIQQRKARHLLIDLTGVPVVDTHVLRGLLEVTHAARLLGAQVILIGIRPEVAQTLVSLGVDLRAMQTHQDLQTALARFVG